MNMALERIPAKLPVMKIREMIQSHRQPLMDGLADIRILFAPLSLSGVHWWIITRVIGHSMHDGYEGKRLDALARRCELSYNRGSRK
jgi:hypothetical protein